MKKYILSLLVAMIFFSRGNSQGCVAIRSVGGLNTMEHASMTPHRNMDEMKDNPTWNLNINHRYFKSYKHFNGTDEQKQRVAEGSDVRNYSYSMDISLQRNLNKKWSIGINVPVVYNERSSKYEHLGNAISNPRYTTFSGGIGDIRMTAYKWLIEPSPSRKGNLLAGVGIKFPTGNYSLKGTFHNTLSTTRLGPVDQSIQAGDGGWGISLELNGFKQLATDWSIYGSAYYLINPKGNNGVSTARGGTSSSSAILYTSNVMSVPDQYLLRTGMNWTRKALTLSLGARYECIPTFDLVGDNTGFRRPGTVIATEPGANYKFKKINLYVYVPIAIFRERNQSCPDILKTLDTKVFSRGDAAFADFSLNLGMGYVF